MMHVPYVVFSGWEDAGFVNDDAVYSVSHLYETVPGNLTVVVTTSNNNGIFTTTFYVAVMNGVHGLILSSNSPQPFDEIAGSEVIFHFELEPGAYPPTVATVIFVWGDGIESTELDFHDDVDQFKHIFNTEGLTTVSARVWNTINRADVETVINLALPIQGLQIRTNPGQNSTMAM